MEEERPKQLKIGSSGRARPRAPQREGWTNMAEEETQETRLAEVQPEPEAGAEFTESSGFFSESESQGTSEEMPDEGRGAGTCDEGKRGMVHQTHARGQAGRKAQPEQIPYAAPAAAIIIHLLDQPPTGWLAASEIRPNGRSARGRISCRLTHLRRCLTPR
jgi:hypothetical protein